MELLVKHELIYGQLMDISEPHLIERYNKAAIEVYEPQRLEMARSDDAR